MRVVHGYADAPVIVPSLADYIERYGSVDATFWEYLSGRFPPEEAALFNTLFATEYRFYAGAVYGLRQRFGSLKSAMKAYQAADLDEVSMRVIELYILPKGVFKIDLT